MLNNNKFIPSLIRCLLSYMVFSITAFSFSASAAIIINNDQLQTLWHNNFELNDKTPVADANVRRSTIYDVRVNTVADTANKFDSFVYMSIPRGGREKWGYSSDDGAEFAKAANLSMSWSSFIYSADVWVEVSLKDGKTISSTDDVIIRPTTLNFVKEFVNSKTIRIKVPFAASGYRFSVEFNKELYTAYSDMSGNSGKLTTIAAGNRAIHTEPKDALLIFAEPKLVGTEAARLIPKTTDGSMYFPPEGVVNNLNNIGADIIYFKPGTYFMPWNYHAQLPANVKWIYLAPGAFVKGAFSFVNDTQGVYKVTGYGVLSGEKYVYEPDTLNEYQHRKASSSDCHGTCVKMLQFSSSDIQQFLDLQGVTIVEPPYHSFVVYGNEATFQMRVENYKQVGGWYWQTDGLELYKNATLKNAFLHSNDDVLKLYHSNVTADNTVIWKNENGPVIQWGWVPRNIDTINVTNTNVIHNRMYWKDVKSNTCIINASPHYKDTFSTTLADLNTTIKNINLDGIRVEGKANCAMRIYALSNLENIKIKNLHIDAWSDLDIGSQASIFTRFSNVSGAKVTVGNEATNGRGLSIENYSVGNEFISRAANNWNSAQSGRLNFDAELWNNWAVWRSDVPMWVAGSFTQWSLMGMTYANNNFQFLVNLGSGNYELKFANTQNWTGKDWGNNTGLSGTAGLTTGGAPNIKFTIVTGGRYTIYMNPVTLFYSIKLTP